jgi:predicted nuclease of predicted toxin-antitoxin system
MTKFLIDEDVNQRAVRTVPVQDKNFDILLPEEGQYKGAADIAVRKRARAERRVLVSQERDFGQFRLQPQDVPDGAIWLRPRRISQRQVGELLASLCRVLTREFPTNPYDFQDKVVEVFPDEVVIHDSAGVTTKFHV